MLGMIILVTAIAGVGGTGLGGVIAALFRRDSSRLVSLLLAFAGIPLTSGFTAKFAAFAPAVAHGGLAGVVMVVVGVLASAVTAFVYFRLIVLMYFTEPTGDEVVALTPSIASTVAITVGALGTVILGVVPGPILDLAGRVSQFIQ